MRGVFYPAWLPGLYRVSERPWRRFVITLGLRNLLEMTGKAHRWEACSGGQQSTAGEMNSRLASARGGGGGAGTGQLGKVRCPSQGAGVREVGDPRGLAAGWPVLSRLLPPGHTHGNPQEPVRVPVWGLEERRVR